MKHGDAGHALVISSISQDGPVGSCFQISLREDYEPTVPGFSTVDLETTLVPGLSPTAGLSALV